MWSVWPDTLRLHLAQGFSLLQLKGAEPVVTQFPATLPLERQLARLDEALQHVAKKRLRVRVTLSGALCPAIDFAVPPDVRRWQERREIARSVAASRLGGAADEFACEIDDSRPGIAGAATAGLVQALQRWAAGHAFKLISVTPLWAAAANSPSAARENIRGVVVQEPDALTLIAGSGHDSRTIVNAVTMPSNGDVAAGQSLVQAWLQESGLAEAEVLRLGFGIKSIGAMLDGPKVWPSHWTAL